MVISTFLSAPIMYASAWLLTIPSMDPRSSVAALQTVSFNISVIGLIALVSWVPSCPLVLFLPLGCSSFVEAFRISFFFLSFSQCWVREICQVRSLCGV